MDKLNTKTKIIFAGSIILFIVLVSFILAKFNTKPKSTVEKEVQSISITDNSSNIFIVDNTLTIPIGTNYLLSVDRIPNTATQRVVLNFKSDNESVATVNEFGLIQTKSIGEAIITVTSSDNSKLSDEVKLKVVDISINVKKIGLSSTKLEINQNDTFLLETTIEPSNATNKSLIWKSTKPEVVSVDNFGNIIGNTVGKSIISATSSNGVSVSCEVTVSQPGTIAESVSIDKKYTEIEKGKAITLLANINPRDAKNNQLTWSSSNEDVIKVDSNGIATGLQLGSAIITTKTSNLKTDSLTMTVVDPATIAKTSSAFANKVIYPSALNLSSSELNLFPGGKEKIKLTVEPENATNKNIILTNDRSGTVAISGNNDEVEIMAQKPGEVDLVFSSMNGKTATLRVKVNDDPNVVSNISLSSSLVNLYVGDKEQITASINPSTAENQSLEWSSSNNNVATVESDGTITGINAGTADITVKTSNGKTNTVRAIVNNNTTDTSEDTDTTDDNYNNDDPGDDNSDSEDYDDNSDNNDDDSGENQNSDDSNDTTDEDAPDEENDTADILASSISFDTSNLILGVGETKQISVIFNPSNVDDKSLTWTSSNTNIATVDDDGLITANSIGQATIKAVTDNNIETTLSLTVSGTVTPIIYIPPTLAPTPTNTMDSPILPPSGADIVKSDNSSTLITSIEKQKKYYITRVWVKDPTTQIRKAVTAGWGSYMQTLPDMAGNEISKKGLQGKIMVGINGSAWHSPGVDNYPAYNYTSLGTMALLDGEFLRNDYGNTGYKYPDIYYYGLDGNGDLQGYHSKKSNLQILYKSIVNAGVKNTFTFFNYPPIVINSKLFITDNGGKKASRTAFCQINNNNFILFTTRSKMTIKQIATVLKSLHCKTAVNLDGGSSIGLVYKSRGSSGVEVIRYAKRKVADMLYVTE